MKKQHKSIIILGLFIMVFSMTACYKSVDIEETGFVMGVGVDKAKEKGEICITYQIALPAAVYGEGGGSEDKKVWNISSSSPNISYTQKLILARINRRANLEHAKVLIIGEDIAKEGIKELIDHYLRNVDIRRETDVLVTTGTAKEVFKIEPPGANSTSAYLSDIIHINGEQVYRISKNINLLQMTKNLRMETDFIVGKINLGEDDIVVEGAAVFKKDRLVGYLNPEEVRKAKWFMNDITQGIIELRDVGDFSGEVIIQIVSGTSKVVPKIRGDKVDFDVDIQVEGDILEVNNFNFDATMERTFILKLEQKIKEKITNECNEILEKAQKDFEADFLGLGSLVRQYNRRWFKEHEKDWREIFKESKINLNVNANIRRIGLVK